jgi:hypothetical protein
VKLPEEDESYLAEKGFDWRVLPDGNAGFLIITGFATNAHRFDRLSVDLMIRIPAGYPMGALDMFYVDPPLKLLASGAHPAAADVFEEYAGRKWQRFSRHLNSENAKWQPGVDNLRSFMTLVARELR